MIHQLIFASPRPGMSEDEFQRYWIDVHAVRYASRIPQIRRYVVDARVPLPGDEEPLWGGIAEIWLANEQEQLESLQCTEFLEGARRDEPRWAAFWRTVVLDTDAHVVVDGPEGGVKLVQLLKRREGLTLNDFRARSAEHSVLVEKIPGLRRYLQCETRDGCYEIGEAVLDAAHQLWFDDVEALERALGSPEFARADADLETFAQLRYLHRMAVREHVII